MLKNRLNSYCNDSIYRKSRHEKECAMEDIKEAKKIITPVVLVIITSLAILGFLSSDVLKTEESKEV